MHQFTVNELIDLSIKKDAQAFRKLVESHQVMVYSLAFRLLCDDEDAKDVVQETFIKVWNHLHRYNAEMKFTTWLYSIATNLCYDRLKTRKRKTAFSLSDQNILNELISNENIEKTLINAELSTIIQQLTDELTPKQKLAFTLRDLEGLEIDEIVKITGLSAEKIKSNLYLARQYIRKKIENI